MRTLVSLSRVFDRGARVRQIVDETLKQKLQKKTENFDCVNVL